MLTHLFSVDSMLKKDAVLGELPSTRQAYRDVLEIAGPSVAEMVLMSLIGSFDVVMVGGLGPAAIAAVGLAGQPRMMMLSLFFALNVGVTAIVARRKGEGRQVDANQTLRNALVMILLLSIVIMVPSLLFSEKLMWFAGAEADTIADAVTYFRILAWFLPINALTMSICAAQRGVGNARITLVVNLTGNLLDVVLNYAMIYGKLGFPRMGIAGAALSTGIGFTVELVLCVVTIMGTRRGDGFLRLTRHDDWRLKKEVVTGILRVGKSALMEQIFVRIGFFWYAIIVAKLGTLAFASHQICMQFLSVSFNFGDGLGVAGTSLVGQMLGRKRPDLSQIYAKVCQRMAFVVAIALASLIVIFRHTMVSWFTDDAQVIELAARVMLMVALFQPFQTSSVVISGALRGAGDTRYVAIIMGMCVMLIRPVVSTIAIDVIQNRLGLPEVALMGAWAASTLDMCVRLICVYRRFNGGKWHAIRV